MTKTNLANDNVGALLSIVLCIAVVFTVEAQANAAPKYRRTTPKLKIDVKKTEKTRGLVRNAVQDEKENAPELTSDGFIEIETLKKNITNAVIAQYKELIAETDPTSPDMADYRFRLAESYAQKQRYWRFRAMGLHEKIDAAKGGEKKQLQDKQALYFKTEKQSLQNSLNEYAKLVAEPSYRNYPRMDEVLFYYGYTLDGVGRIADSRKVYRQLIQNYPDSKYIPQALLGFADYFFEQGDLDNAEKFYDKVLQFPKASIYAFALYKKGWVYLNQEKAPAALATFFDVARITKGVKKAAVLNRAARKDFVRAYAEAGRPEKAYVAFQRVDKEYAMTMLEILGSIYLDRGDGENAIYTYRELIGLNGKSPEVCEWQGNVLNAMISVGDQQQKVDEVVNLVNVYLAHKKAKILQGEKLEECRENAQGTSGEMAKIWHNEAVKTINAGYLGNAENLYHLYIDSFPRAADVGVMRYYYADLLWQRAEYEKNPRKATERWEQTAVAFTEVAHSGTLKGQELKEAAYAAVLGWKNALAVDPRVNEVIPVDTGKSKKIKTPVPKPIGEREKKMISAFDVYIKHVTDSSDEELVMMKFLKARVFWRHDHLDESIPYFYEIIDKHPQHETAGWAANILLDSLNRLQRYEDLTAAAGKILKNELLLKKREDLRELAFRIQNVGLRKAAERLEDDKKYIACGQAYTEIYNSATDPKGMDEVLYNAGVCFEDGKSIGLAIRSYAKLDKEFPRSVHAQKALVRMGSAYGAIASYKEAAEKYEEYASRFGGEKDAADALNNAVTYRKGIGDQKQAISNIETFVKKYKRKKKQEAAAAMFGLAGIYESRGDTEMVVRVYRRYLKKIGRSGGLDRMLIANAKIGELLWNKSCRSGGVDGACIKITRERVTRKGRNRRRAGLDLPTQCGPESKIKLVVLERSKKIVKEAQKHFRAALALARAGGIRKASEDRRPAAIYWMAASRFYMNGVDYEKFLALSMPTNLSFSPNNPKKKATSEKRLIAWHKKKTNLMKKVRAKYLEIKDITGGGAAWAVGSAARVGQLSQNFSDNLYTAEIPKEVRTGPYAEEGVDAYCDALTTLATPLEDSSLDAYGFCLKLSTKLNWFNDWSRMCERELGQIRPNMFPTATEVHGTPNNVANVIDLQGLITTIAQ